MLNQEKAGIARRNGRVTAVKSENESSDSAKPAWHTVLKYLAARSFKRTLYIGIPVFVTTVLTQFEVVSGSIADVLVLSLSVCIFVLSIPLAVIVRLDQLASYFASATSREFSLLIGVLCVFFNLFLIDLALALLRGGKVSKEVRKKEGKSAR